MFVKLPTHLGVDFWVNVDRVILFRPNDDADARTALWLDDGSDGGWQMAVALPADEVALRLQGLEPVHPPRPTPVHVV